MSDDEIRAEWSRFQQNSAAWADWRRNYLAAVTLAQTDDVAAFESNATQRKLWSAEDAMSSGLGRSVNTDAALAHKPLLEAFRALRAEPLATDVVARGKQLQQRYEQLLGRVIEAGVSRRPRAKLLRYLALLLPGEFTCLLSDKAFEATRDRLLLNGRSLDRAETHVRIRARLREVLGAESGTADHVNRSIFCWWLHEPLAKSQVGATPPPAPIVPWAFDEQYKGLSAVSGYGEYVRQVAREARKPLPAAELFQAWRARTGDTTISEAVFTGRLSLLRGLGFLDRDSQGAIVTTTDGLDILDDDDPLIQRLLERVFGVAHLLKILDDSAGGLTRDELNARLQALYPAWTSAFAPGSLRRWLDHFGLIERRDGRWHITDDGRAWCSRVTSFPEPRKPDSAAGPKPPTPGALRQWQFADVHERLAAQDLVLDLVQLRALHAAWRAHTRKHFVLLTGLSGTGKTQIVLRYARAVCDLLDLAPEQHIALVPVSPEWHDPTALLGYVNPLRAEASFHPGPLLPLLLHAVEEPDKPHFLVLDEMNLAPVERYFAPFLSAKESGEALPLHHEDEDVGSVPASLPWPANLFVAGTVNMDETTHPFSDKVLDRAFTLEYWDVDLDALFKKLHREHDAFPMTADVLKALHDALRPARRHFGYRSAREVIDFVIAGVAETGAPAVDFLDAAVFGKVLPRVRGDDTPVMRKALDDAAAIAGQHGLLRSKAKLAAMIEQLGRTGLTKFHA